VSATKAEKALNFLVGQVLKREPQANPTLVRQLIESRLADMNAADMEST